MEPICIKCEREWAGDYPVCMLCAPDTHFPHRSDCIHCEMLTDLQSKDRAFELMLKALKSAAQCIENNDVFKANVLELIGIAITAAEETR